MGVFGKDDGRLDLTIVTPTYNSEKTIFQTCESVKALVEHGAEHIIVDSYSTDNTIKFASQYDNTILYYPRGNMYKAINFGVNHSSKSLITYINSDDLLDSHSIMEAISMYPNIDMLYGYITFIDERDNKLFDRRTLYPSLLRYVGRYYNPIFQQGMIFSRSVFDKLEGFNESFKYSSDMDFILNIIYMDFNVARVNKVLGFFRISDGQLSTKDWHLMREEGPLIRKSINKKYKIKLNFISLIFSRMLRLIFNFDLIVFGYLRKIKNAIF